MLLPLHPVTDLLPPATTPLRSVRAKGVGVLPPYAIRAAARALGISPQVLRRRLAAGQTLRQIARLRGRTYKHVTRAIVARLHARARRALR
jgi:hypothetical protein